MPVVSPTSNTPEVICLGETMVLVGPVDARPLAEAELFTLGVGGAESTVALYLTERGHPTEWVSQVGADPLGRRLVSTLERHGVGTAHVGVLEEAPTAVYFKDPGEDGTRVHYYRSGSAASRMGPEILDAIPLEQARVVHVSGITAALSPSCALLLEAVFRRARRGGTLVSFDVNYRPNLWGVAEAAPVLLDLARRADIVFVGRDEAQTLWGTTDADSVRELIHGAGILVVKDGAVGATEYTPAGESTFLAAPRVEVVEEVGAGDAFASGYLSALLRGAGASEKLRVGHELASRALSSVHDFVPEVSP